jgi:hypothetical protein
MKPNRFSKKLELHKRTIANLSDGDLRNMRGGTTTTFIYSIEWCEISVAITHTIYEQSEMYCGSAISGCCSGGCGPGTGASCGCQTGGGGGCTTGWICNN